MAKNIRESVANREFVIWLGSMLTFMVFALSLIDASGISAPWAFLLGVALTVPIEMFRDWLIEWREVRRTAEKLPPMDGGTK